ncbi:hypothetical protein GCM10011607_11980 [Shewanella inventionis]|uniref:Phage protein n=1 Tax=Shewanella inventionis TaxID=1738770 RepID=A0ABQ1IVD3_9GAMM|nr:hypothetical protein GCM10011607_11980 [Shewanella inventionis]
MDYLNIKGMSEQELKYLYKFRHSKCLDTLDRQCELLELRNKNNKSELNAINYAWCVRENELQKNGSPVFKRAITHK